MIATCNHILHACLNVLGIMGLECMHSLNAVFLYTEGPLMLSLFIEFTPEVLLTAT